MSKHSNTRTRIIRDQMGAWDVAHIYYVNNRPVSFRRYRPNIEVRATKKDFDRQLHIIQSIIAESLRYGIIDVLKLDLGEL